MSNIRPLFRILLGIWLINCCWACQSEPKEDIAKDNDYVPNILFILTDDQGYGDLSLHGNPVLQTPRTDQLFRESARFSRFYVSPVCAPTRASFLSGQYHPRTGAVFVTRRRETMSDSIYTIAEHLQTAGYRTGLYGKWHNGATPPYHPASQGFEEFLGFCLGHFNNYFDSELEDEAAESVPFQGYLTKVLTDSAWSFIEQPQSDPFFCMLSYQAPHTPVQAPESFIAPYRAMGLKDRVAGIYGMIACNDYHIGRLLDSLDSRGLLDNTIVIFSTDNGPNGDRFNGGLRGRKAMVDEGGVRVPFAIRMPNGHPINGQRINTMAAHIDLLPTLAELSGKPIPASVAEELDGRSLLPLLENEASIWIDRPIYTFIQGYDFSPYPGGFRTQDQLYILREPDVHEVYNLRADPGQQANLFNPRDTAHQALAEQYARFAATVARPDRVAPPIQLGNRESPATSIRLLAHEGEPFGQAHFHDQYGWANDWVEDVYGPESGIAWPVDVLAESRYLVELSYELLLPSQERSIEYEDIGFAVTEPPAEVQIQIGNSREYFRALPFAGKRIESPDIHPRKEAYERTWGKTQRVLRLPAGQHELRLTAPELNRPGLAIKALRLEPIND